VEGGGREDARGVGCFCCLCVSYVFYFFYYMGLGYVQGRNSNGLIVYLECLHGTVNSPIPCNWHCNGSLKILLVGKLLCLIC